MDDPRLDENFSFMFLFKKGDQVKSKDEPGLRGEITDGVFVGELPASITASNDSYKKGRTLYELKLSDKDRFIVADNEIEKE
jgi:hypothetical protein